MSETGFDAGAGRQRRDALGRLCFLLHCGVVIYVLLGWLFANREVLTFYLLFLPVLAVQWQINSNSCVLNNLESYLRTGRWRDDANREEGAWLFTLAKNTLGLQIQQRVLDLFIYALMAILWALALAHWQRVF